MSKLVLITTEGRVLSDDKPPPVVEEHQEDPLWITAQREAERQSTVAHKKDKE